MSSEVSIFGDKANVVPTEGRRLSKLGQSLASRAMSRRIQTNTNGTFKRLVNGEQIGNAVRGELDIIIVDLLPNVSRVYYREQFDPSKEATLPNCWSNIGDKPESNVPEASHSNCAECPMNIKGSGQNGSKACRYQRRIAVLVAGDSTGEVYQFNIPAKSLFGKGTGNTHPFEQYVKFLLANGESPDTVVTKVFYDDNADTLELLFSPQRSLSDAEYQLVVAAQARPETSNYTKITVAQADGVTKAPAKAEAVVTPKAAAKPVVRSEDPDGEVATPVTEPTKRVGKKEAAPKPTADLASVIDQWGGDDS